MGKLIATGLVVDSDDLSLAASVYAEFDEEGVEVEEEGAHYVVLKLSARNQDAMPTDALSFDDIMTAVESDESGQTAGGAVPGFDGHDDVTLSAPAEVIYSKTKAFKNHDGVPQVYAQLRYRY